MRDLVSPSSPTLGLLCVVAAMTACGGSVTFDDERDDSGGHGGSTNGGSAGEGAKPEPSVCGCAIAIGLDSPGCVSCATGASQGCIKCPTDACLDVQLCLSAKGYTAEALEQCFTKIPPDESNLDESMAWGNLKCACSSCTTECLAPAPAVCQ